MRLSLRRSYLLMCGEEKTKSLMQSKAETDGKSFSVVAFSQPEYINRNFYLLYTRQNIKGITRVIKNYPKGDINMRTRIMYPATQSCWL